jgi:spermidine/putrescine-binding protein
MGQFDAVLSNPATRRTFLRSMAVAGGMGVLAACRKENSPAAGTAAPSVSHAPLSEETGELLVHEWAGFETPWLWKDYEQQGYPEPTFSFLTNTEGVIAKTQGGFEWDITHPETGYIQDYINMDALQPWDTSLISNFAGLSPQLEAHGNIGGQQYEIVTDWGYSGVIIRSDKLDPTVNSYSYLFDDAAAGHIGWFDTPWILQQAAMVQGISATDGFAMTDEQLEAAKNYAIEKSGNVYSIWVDYTQMWDDIRTGNMWAAYAWPDAYVVLKEEVPVQYIRPKEGVLSWAEGLVLRKDTEQYYHAHDYANAWTDVAVAQRLISTWGYGHSNTNVDLSKIDPDVVTVFGLDDPQTNLAEPVSYFDRYQPDRARYNRAWDEVKAAMGN